MTPTVTREDRAEAWAWRWKGDAPSLEIQGWIDDGDVYPALLSHDHRYAHSPENMAAMANFAIAHAFGRVAGAKAMRERAAKVADDAFDELRGRVDGYDLPFELAAESIAGIRALPVEGE